MNLPVPIKDSWQFCPLCGSSGQSGNHPFCCDACGHSHYFSPCTAVGALIVDATGQMLFIVRGKQPGQGKLGLPGGFVDAGESAEQALVREIDEELSLRVTSFSYLASFPNTYAYGGVVVPVTDLFFMSEVASLDNIVPQAGEVSGWKFLTAAEVTSEMLAFETHRQALQAFLARQS